MKRIICISLCLSALVLGSCATVALDSSTMLEKPVAMNAAGQKAYDVIAEFSVNDKAGWLLGFVPVNKPAGDKHDYLAEILQAQIDKAGGDGVINVRIRSQFNFPDFLINVVTLGTYLTRTVTVSGEIIKYRQ